MQPGTDIRPGSEWVPCDAKGEAPCPHCGAKGWHRAEKWAGCEHAVGPGSLKLGDGRTEAAMIFNPAGRRALCAS